MRASDTVADGPAQGRPTGLSLGRLAELSRGRDPVGGTLSFRGEVHTEGQLHDRSTRVARGLVEAGLQPGDRVVVLTASSPETLVAYGAAWHAGGAVTPVLYLLTEPEVAHVLADSGATLVITTPPFAGKVAAAARSAPSVRAIVLIGDVGELDTDLPVLAFAELEQRDRLPLAERSGHDLAALLYTGGTTGRSRGVMLSHDAMSAAAWNAAQSADPGLDRVLLPLPLSHVFGLSVAVLGLHYPFALHQVLLPWSDPTAVLGALADQGIRVTTLVPSMLHLLLQQRLEDHDLSSLRRVVVGGAPLPAEAARAFEQRVPGCEVHEVYGCTEYAGGISGNRPGERRLGSVGRPSPLTELRLERADGSVAGPGENGEICARGPMVMTGYWNDEAQTATALRGGWLHTGDVGRIDDEGFLHVVDRLKDVVIRGGYNVYPRDVEEALLAHPDLAQVVVIGRPDPTYGEEVVAFVVPTPGARVRAEDVVAFSRTVCAASKYPRIVHVVAALPLTAVGKVDRKALRRRDQEGRPDVSGAPTTSHRPSAEPRSSL